MLMNSPVVKIKYLFVVILFLIFVKPAYSWPVAAASVAELNIADTIKTPTNDTLNRTPGGKAETLIQTLPDSVIYKKRDFKAEEIVRGERLFFGLAYINNKSVNCAACHNTIVSDTLNWNPDALEISKKYLNKSALELSRVLLRPVGQKMAQVHKDIHLSPEDIVLVKAYMDRFVNIGLREDKPVITNLLLFIISTVLL